MIVPRKAHLSSKKLLEQCQKMEKLWGHVLTSTLPLHADNWYNKVTDLIEKQQTAPIWMSDSKVSQQFSILNTSGRDCRSHEMLKVGWECKALPRFPTNQGTVVPLDARNALHGCATDCRFSYSRPCHSLCNAKHTLSTFAAACRVLLRRVPLAVGLPAPGHPRLSRL